MRLGWREVEQAFNGAVERHVFPGACVIARRGAEVLFQGAFGYRTIVPERHAVNIDIVFDLASLTKVLATTIAVMMLVCEGKLRLDDRMTRFVPNFAVHGKDRVTIRHLLAHCSGLAAWRPYYKLLAEIECGAKVNFMASPGAKQRIFEEIHRERLEAPPGAKTVYSDLNFIILGEAVEQASGLSLQRFCQDRIYRELCLTATGFIDLSRASSHKLGPLVDMFAATEQCSWRNRVLIGEVDDENAFAMGGVAGHAGLFAPVREVDRIAAELIACYKGRSDMVAPKVVREFWTRDGAVEGSTWALGWDTPSPHNSSSGHRFPPTAVGHLGFTGASIWIDPEREIAVSILTNRVHPSRDSQAIREFRPAIHDLIMEAIEGA